MAAEIDVSINVRAFEELTYLKSMGEGLYSIQMRPNYNIIVGHPNRTNNWQRFYFYVKSDEFAFEEPPGDTFLDHPDTAAYPEEFRENARAVALLAQESWDNITVERIRRVIDRISRKDWRSDLLPLVTGRKRRFSLLTRAEQGKITTAREMKALPDLSAIIGKRLSGSSSDVPSRTPHGVDRRESPPAVIRPSPVPDSVGSEPSREILEIAAEVRQNEPPQKKKKKHAEKDPVPSVGAENRELVVHEESSRGNAASPSGPSVDRGSDGRDHSKTPEGRREAGVSQSITATTPRSTPSAPGGSSTRKKGPVKFPDHVEFKYDGDTPLAYDPEECAELVHQIRGGAKDMPPVKDLIFKDAYVDAARTKVLSDGSLNYVVELYDTALKGTISKLKNTERLVRVNNSALDLKTSEFKAVIEKAETEHSRLLAEKKAQKAKFTEKFGELKGKFKTAGEKIRVLEREKASLEEEKAAWEKEKAATALRHLKEINRLRDSRSYEVTLERVRVQTEMIAKCNRHFNNIREREAHRDDLDTARCLYSQAFGAKKCLEALKEKGIDIPQESIDLFAGQEKEYGEEAARPDVGEIPEEYLCMSSLALASKFLNENDLAAIDPYGSNAGLINAGTAVILQTPCSSQGEPSAERSAVPLVEGSTAPPVLPSSDPGSAPLGASSMVDEEAPDPVLPAEGRETRPGLDDLVELSDSSIERSGQNESSDGAPPGVGED
ncbi:PREDICTED: uncharacterized protein LOC106324154 [Brassica oleracea var. oleracea]|uniref:uncharacterized protein LOC106324154 n=1 Tax=Brassica oleracea var. oleracea TaxID=109376 RepID=UPI0006A6B2FB|nr:PREDICTED: uncharacterized protein LOC106324154 [Brassica oleracea var. oleracea]